MAAIDQACLRILQAKFKLGLFDNPYKYIDESRPANSILTAGTRKVAREAAAHACVLLKNDPQLLPLQKNSRIALIGPLADNRRNMLGTWVVAGDWQQSVSVKEGLQSALGKDAQLVYAKGANISDDTMLVKNANALGLEIEPDKQSPDELLKAAVATASNADVVVAVMGEAADMSGESSSRSDIGLPESQQQLLKALAATGKPIVLVLINGRPLTLTWESEHLPAILEAWAPGTEAGNAIADVLLGRYVPAGKLTATFPRSVGQIPIYYNHKNTGRPYNGIGPGKFTSYYMDVSNDPLYPFGYGLSYTNFSYSDVSLSKKKLQGNETLTATVTVTNTGKYAGEEVVQLYITDPVASVTRSVKDLKGFKKIMLQPGEKQTVNFAVTTEQLKFYNSALQFNWEPGEFIIQIGTNSAVTNSASVQWMK